ncbi:MAG: GNAT family N-acetyltransferase [Bacteriovoracaceae bacterium]|nr:GNAT family N-acetyltransferase [Bacteriovoracaceae bacterium]
MNKIELREVIKSDLIGLEEVVSIVTSFYTKRPFPFTLNEALSSQSIYFKAYHQNEFIGVTGIAIKTPFLAETVKTVVKEEFKGKKLGLAISLAVEEECRQRGFKKVMTTIYADNHVMIGIKLKQGYRIEGFHPDHEAPGFDEYSLGKIL